MACGSLSPLERTALMGSQYQFDVVPSPFDLISKKINIKKEKIIKILMNEQEKGIVKRVGFYVNYRSEGLKAALIGVAAGDRFSLLAKRYAGDPLVTHVYLRNHPKFNVWIIIKRKSINEIIYESEKLKEIYNFDNIVLFGKRTYKLSVKFDLDKGISKSGRYSLVPENTTKPSDEDLRIARLVKKLPIVDRPFRLVAEKLGISEGEVVSRVEKLLREGVLLDPGAVLDGRRVGFEHNVMVAVEPEEGYTYDEVCNCIASRPWTTHVVLRESYPLGAWRHLCYFMLHACSEALAKEAMERILSGCPVGSFLWIKSLADLKPGVVR